jgi:uncharacterized Zn finger protein
VSRYYDAWTTYVPVAERQRRAARKMEMLRKKGHRVAPVVIQGRVIATTFWGRAWCDNLEGYRDLENRLQRGRTYVRNGSVVDLQIAPSEVTAMVSGSSIYKVKISIGEVGKKLWASICEDCAGRIDSLVELLQGRFSQGVMERICRQGGGLFPKPTEIQFSCSCPDYASMCKHVAAALYGVGARLDEQPELLFRLRAVDESELVARVDKVLPLARQEPAAGKLLDVANVSALFALDMDSDEETMAADGASATLRKPVRAKKRVQGEPSSVRHTAAAQQSVRSPAQTRAGKQVTARRTAGGEAPSRKRTSLQAPAKMKNAAEAARKTKQQPP